MTESIDILENSFVFYELNRVGKDVDQNRITAQLTKAGFTGNLKVFNLGFDSKDAISFVVDGIFQGQKCCCAVGYEMQRQNLTIKKMWNRHASS